MLEIGSKVQINPVTFRFDGLDAIQKVVTKSMAERQAVGIVTARHGNVCIVQFTFTIVCSVDELIGV